MEPSPMIRLGFAAILALAACSQRPDQTQPSTSTNEKRVAEQAAARSGRQACQHLQSHEQFDVGVSPYEACLGEQANRTRPANRQLCDLAKSTMAASGVCVLAE